MPDSTMTITANGTEQTFKSIELDEFLPLITFDADAFLYLGDRPPSMRTELTAKKAELDARLDADKKIQPVHSVLMWPGTVKLPFTLSKGSVNTLPKGFFKAVIETKNSEAAVTSITENSFDFSNGDSIVFDLTVELKGYTDKDIEIRFYANDSEEALNSAEIKDAYCGCFIIHRVGTSKVGHTLLQNILSLKTTTDADWYEIAWDTEIKTELEDVKVFANKYLACNGVCYLVTMARIRKAYKDTIGNGVIDLTLGGAHYQIAGTQKVSDAGISYGVGQILVNAGLGVKVPDKDLWSGKLKRGASLQRWKWINTIKGWCWSGHSVVFSHYNYDDNGIPVSLTIYDYGGEKTWLRDSFDPTEGIYGLRGNTVYADAEKTKNTSEWKVLGVNLLGG